MLAFAYDDDKAETIQLGESREAVTGERNLSFGKYDAKRNNLYLLHEVQDFEGEKNTGAISRWTVRRTDKGKLELEKQEVMRRWCMAATCDYKGVLGSFIALQQHAANK